jgi:hypothetical protein
MDSSLEVSRRTNEGPHLGYVTRETLTAAYTDTLEAVVAFADGALSG